MSMLDNWIGENVGSAKQPAHPPCSEVRGQLQRLARTHSGRMDDTPARQVGAVLPAREPREDGGPEAAGSGAWAGEASDDQNEESAIAAVVGPAVRAPGQMPVDGRGLFRHKLAIQIFPQSLRDLETLHSYPFLTAQVRQAHGHALLNSTSRPEVPRS
jgi:hypothetical protein